MTEGPAQSQIDAASAYEAFFVPALFREWAPRLADAARLAAGQRVLDVACGTGVLAREAVSRVGANGRVVGLDPDPGMLAVAARLEPGVEWRLGRAEALPYPAHAFDAVLSQFGLMFFADRAGAVGEMLRVLAPGGRLAVAVWDGLEHAPAYAAEVALLERIAGREAADALRAPFALGDVAALRGLFEAAGAADLDIATHHGTARFPSLRAMLEGDLRGWLPVMGVELPEAVIARVLEAAADALGPWVTAGGQVEFAVPAHLVSAARG